MKKYICLLMGAALLTACEQKETTVTNPPAEKKESNTTIIKESPAPVTKTETKTDINVTHVAFSLTRRSLNIRKVFRSHQRTKDFCCTRTVVSTRK